MRFQCFKPASASGPLVLLASALALWPSPVRAQLGSPAGGSPLNNQGVGLGIGLGNGGLPSGGGGPGGILGNLAGGLPGQAGNTQQTPGLDPNGRFFLNSTLTGSGQLTGPLPIVYRFAGIGGLRTGMGGMNGGMNPMMGGMNPMMGGMNPMMGGMNGGMNPMMGGGNPGGGMGNMGGNMGNGGSGNQSQNFALLPPGVQLNVGYNTLIGMPMTQSPMGQMNGMNPYGNGMGMPGMGRNGMGMNPMMGGKMMMGMGNGGYGL